MPNKPSTRRPLSAHLADLKAWVVAKAPKAVHAAAVVAVALGVRPDEADANPPPPTPQPSDPACAYPPEQSLPATAAEQKGKFAQHLAPNPWPSLLAGAAPWPGLALTLSPDGTWPEVRRMANVSLTALSGADRAKINESLALYIEALKVEPYFAAKEPLAKVAQTLKALIEAMPSPEAALVTAFLNEVEAAGAADPWLVTWLFQLLGAQLGDPLTAAEGQDLARLLGRTEHLARNADAALRARVIVRMKEPRPWMSKSARPRPYVDVVIPAEFGDGVERVWPSVTAGAWQTETLLPVEVLDAPAGAMLWRRGGEIPLSHGDQFSLTRLDIVVVPKGASGALTLKSAAGVLTVEADQALTAWNAIKALDEGARVALRAQVELAATRCDPEAQKGLHKHLWLAHGLIRARLAQPDPGPGASALRLILSLFDA